MAILKEADAGKSVKEIWKKYGMSSATYDKWKSIYGGLGASDIKRLKELEQEYDKLWRTSSSAHSVPEPFSAACAI